MVGFWDMRYDDKIVRKPRKYLCYFEREQLGLFDFLGVSVGSCDFLSLLDDLTRRASIASPYLSPYISPS